MSSRWGERAFRVVVPWLMAAAATAAASCGGATPAAKVASAAEEERVAVERGPGRAQSPLELTAEDGTGLQLTLLDARAVVEGPLSFTELRLVFLNAEARVREGTFAIELPPDASVTRFAMAIGGVMQEGEVVERLEGSKVYESFMHRRVDPALLETSRDGRFRARVFPIQPKGLTEVVLSYVHPLRRDDEPWRLPLTGMPRIDELSVEVRSRPEGGGPLRTDRFARSLWQPEGDVVVRGVSRARGVGGGIFAVARVVPPVDDRPDPPAGLTVLVDTSASSARGFSARLDRLAEVLEWWRGEAPADAPASVVAFDQTAETVWSGQAAALGPASIAPLRARGAMGATRLDAALDHVAGARSAGHRVLLVSDGIATAGAIDAGGLVPVLDRLRAAGVRRVDSLAHSRPGSASWLHAAARGGSQPGAVLGLDGAGSGTVERALGRAASGELRISVRGAAWHWPTTIAGAVPGEPIVVLAERSGEGPLVIGFEGAKTGTETVPLAPAPPALAERAVADARVRQLSLEHGALPEGDARRAPLRALALSLALKHRVLSELTSLLVLESDADYQRFGIDRRASSRVLAVGDAGVAVVDRPRVLLPPLGDRRGPFDALRLENSDRTEVDRTVAPPPDLTADTDGDGIEDRVDGCPNERGGPDADPKKSGCPRFVRVIEREIVILEKIQFELGSARIHPSSAPIQEAIASVMAGHPEIELVEIGGHTDDGGPDDANLLLSDARAQAVRDDLIRRGVAPGRLTARGYGETRPIADNKQAEGRDRNRRVEFLILRLGGRDPRAGSSGGPPPPPPPSAPPLIAVNSPLTNVLRALDAGDGARAVMLADTWRLRSPGDALAYVALGEALRARGDAAAAARAFGSLLDLGPDRAELRRTAGLHLDALATTVPGARTLAVEAYRGALAARADHPSAHRLLAFALARAGHPDEGFAVLARALRARPWAAERFPGVDAPLREDLGLLAAAWARTAPEPAREAAVAAGVAVDAAPSLRFVLTWESDASNLDLDVVPQGGGATAGARLDVRDGYGPDTATFPAPPTWPYQLSIRQSRRGAQGHVHGKVEVVEHDGVGGLRFDERPFVILGDADALDLGTVDEASMARAGR